LSSFLLKWFSDKYTNDLPPTDDIKKNNTKLYGHNSQTKEQDETCLSLTELNPYVINPKQKN